MPADSRNRSPTSQSAQERNRARVSAANEQAHTLAPPFSAIVLPCHQLQISSIPPWLAPPSRSLQLLDSASATHPYCARPLTMPSLAHRRSTIAEMRIATWCVDGINPRWQYLRHWLDRRKPDVVALQKTFAATDQFPVGALLEAGYASASHSRDGEFRNGWGVAVLSQVNRPKPQVLQVGLPGQQDRGARFLTVRTGDLEFSSVYALYGNPRKHGIDGALERKISWLKLLREHLGKRSTRPERCILAGDFNVVSDGDSLPRTFESHKRRERGTGPHPGPGVS